jgi:hypothetical protein
VVLGKVTGFSRCLPVNIGHFYFSSMNSETHGH